MRLARCPWRQAEGVSWRAGSSRACLAPALRLLAALFLALGTSFAPALAQPADASPSPDATRSSPSANLRSLEAASRSIADAPATLWADLEAGRYAEAIAQLLALEPRWAMDPTYNALLAETALAAGRYAEATLALERLVLLEPGNAGAWLDLAVASLAMGDTETARRALDTLERDFTIPPGIRLMTVSLRARMAAADAALERMWVRASLLFGRDSNANGGLIVNSLVLTPTAGSIELPVDPAYLPRPSNLWLATLDLSGRWATGWGPVEGRLRLGEKFYISEPDYNTHDLALTLAGRIGGSRASYWMGEWRRIDMGRGLLVVDVPRFSVTREFAAGSPGCRPGLGLEYEGRRYAEALGVYDARIFWLAAGVRCPLWRGDLSVLARAGDDNGPADRPGGDTLRRELAAAWQGVVAPGVELSAGVVFARSDDAQGYSPLIAGGASRDIDRFTARAELAWRLRDRWHALAWVEHTRQDSNIDLFGLRQTVLMTGLRFQSW